MSRRLRAMICLAVMLFAPLAPAIGPAAAQTNPPSGSGDWTIPANDVTYFNNSQALIQGDINVYGTLIIDNSNVYVWGSNNGDRDVIIYSGGRIELRNGSVLSAYSNACFDLLSHGGSSLLVDASRVQKSCLVNLDSRD